MNIQEMTDKCIETIGHLGRMISGSKSGYFRQYPNNVAIFNANICVKSVGKVWFGDLDVTKDESKLMRLAILLGEDIYVLREQDARFACERNPKLDAAVAVISSTGINYQNVAKPR